MWGKAQFMFDLSFSGKKNVYLQQTNLTSSYTDAGTRPSNEALKKRRVKQQNSFQFSACR